MPFLRRIAPDWLTLVSAFLITLSAPPWDLAPLMWFALVPWFAAIHRAPTTGRAFAQGLWLSVFFTLSAFHWVGYVLHEFGGLPWALAGLFLSLFSLGAQPQYLLFAPIRHWLLKRSDAASLGFTRGLPVYLGLAFLFCGMEWALPKLFKDTLGHVFYEHEHLRQVADLGGAILLTLIVYVVNEGLWMLALRVLERKEPSVWPAIRKSLPQLALGLGLALAAWGYGLARLPEIRRAQENPKHQITFAAIQANIGDFDKVASERGVRGAAEKIIRTYFEMSDQALKASPRPDAIIWPETSYPSTFRTPDTTDELSRDQRVERFARDRGVPLLFGGYDRQGPKDFNTFFFLSPEVENGSDLQIYHKNKLLLFGEYIPMADKIEFLDRAFPQVGNFGRGLGPEVLTLKLPNHPIGEVKVGPIICYEALFPNFVIDEVRRGAQLILNITNDSWFGPYGEPQLHLALSAFRSIETRTAQVRSTNTGISALIWPDGEITQRTRIGVPEILSVTAPVIDPIPTLMMVWGDWFGAFAMAVGLALVGAVWASTRERSPVAVPVAARKG